jgi:hypothetical protein
MHRISAAVVQRDRPLADLRYGASSTVGLSIHCRRVPNGRGSTVGVVSGCLTMASYWERHLFESVSIPQVRLAQVITNGIPAILGWECRSVPAVCDRSTDLLCQVRRPMSDVLNFCFELLA